MRDFPYGPSARPAPHANWRSAAFIHACAILSVVLAVPAVAEEKSAEIIAAHIRNQGYTCQKALSAQRNRRASKPDEPFWVLRCSNAAYRVRLIPDMAAKVERIK